MKVKENFSLMGIAMLLIIGLVACGKQASVMDTYETEHAKTAEQHEPISAMSLERQRAEASVKKLAAAVQELEKTCSLSNIRFQEEQLSKAYDIYQKGIASEQRNGPSHELTLSLFSAAENNANAGYKIAQTYLTNIHAYCPR